jgi:hypothetical protein
MPRRSRFAEPAETWLRKHAAGKPVSTKEFWDGLSKEHPALTTPSEGRKTPKATCMRDLRKDPAFELGDGRIRLRK